MAAVLFRLLDCPLAADEGFDRFDPLQTEDIDGIRAEFAEAGKQYIKVYLTSDGRGDGRGTATEVMMGSYEALTRRGVKLPRAEMERMYKKSEASQVLYLAFDRRFRLAYAVEYRVARSFVQAVEAFAAMGYATSVVTYDPLVEHDLLKVARLQRLPAVELVRPARIETPRKSRSGALLATGRSVDLLYPVAACHRMKKAYRRAHLAGWLALLLGFGLSFLSAFWFGGALLSAATVTVWQCIPAAVMTVISLASTTNRGLYLTAPGGKAKGTKASSPGEADRLPTEDKPATSHSAKKDKINKE